MRSSLQKGFPRVQVETGQVLGGGIHRLLLKEGNCTWLKTRVKQYLREEVLTCRCLLPRHLLVSGGGGRPRLRRPFVQCSHFYSCLTSLLSGRKFCAILQEKKKKEKHNIILNSIFRYSEGKQTLSAHAENIPLPNALRCVSEGRS